MLNYFYDCYSILNKVYSSGAFLKQAILDTPIEEKNRALTIKTCYGVLDKDITLTYYLNALVEKSPKLVIRTILKIAMYDIKFLRKKDYAVVKNAVELTKKLGKGGTSGFVNAFLRKFIQSVDGIKMPENLAEFLSVKYSYPQFAVEELLKKYSQDRVKKIISAENGLTTLVFYDVDGKKYLTDKNAEFEDTPFYNVYSVKKFVRNSDYDKGVYTYQALGSVAICDSIDGCDNLLDTCAAPGGKSIRLSYKCKNVVSLDIHEHRVKLIEDYKLRMGRKNISCYVKDAKVFFPEFESKFDAVLCDVPCSGLGVLNDNPDMKLNKSMEKVLELNEEQFSIINTASKYVKKGGYLYYSTCSILDREDVDVVNKFLQTNGNYELVPLDSKLNHEDQKGMNLFLPDISSGLGFFIAKLKRVK